MKEPNFFIAGAQRCCTTWVYQMLDEHPQVFLAKPVRPEPKFFLRENLSIDDRQCYLDRWFRNAENEIAVGEKSTSYLESGAVAKRIEKFFPDAKFVFVLRHPVERALSNYRFSKLNGLETETLETALAKETSRCKPTLSDVSVNPFAYLARGHYVRYLQPFFDVFGEDKMAILLLDDLQQRHQRTLDGLFRFLQVAPGFEPRAAKMAFNQTPDDSLRMSESLLADLVAHFRESNVALERLIQRDLSHWNKPPSQLRCEIEDT
ncbi:Sulfotransferase domain protein [Planctomycetes bacterium CA13]|uniref:Sulfotransferase domain protein n=1 Tax=Novipirellula herctigrandis TaxID=2527986 RepID=A0A5C5ZAT6_9BACT|nr:Sulfotransferase domain protein [Planctomycetes bacterium CA13]